MWHVRHFEDPRQINEGSIMPAYPWLLTSDLDFDVIPSRMKAMQRLGVPYSDAEISSAVEMAQRQAAEIAGKIEEEQGRQGLETKKVVALIAYLDRLGVDVFAAALKRQHQTRKRQMRQPRNSKWQQLLTDTEIAIEADDEGLDDRTGHECFHHGGAW